jgi:GntR family transcriptional repressor for pyruvate dehydrogenase complex
MINKYEPRPRTRGSLVVKTSDELKEAIQAGTFKPGMKLPSEAKLTESMGVSRTVIREAIAALRADGLVEARQGAGVFVLEAQPQETLPFQNLNYERISSVIELLELRTGVEIEAAGLAAVRRSPQQEENIFICHRQVLSCLEAGQSTAEADFALHIAIADASNNPRFREFLTMIGNGVIPRAALHLHKEHEQIIEAIATGDEDGAREAMRSHLKGSQMRYRAILRQVRDNL